MKTDEIKKGDRFRLRSGWMATMEDNTRGNTRLATVEGFVTEMGSVYAFDIVGVVGEDGVEVGVELTEKQVKFMNSVKAAGF